MAVAPSTPALVVAQQGSNFVLFNDGARTDWLQQLVCTCVLAKGQPWNKNCCKHTVFVMREGIDRIRVMSTWLPMALPSSTAAGFAKDIAWVQIDFDDKVDGVAWLLVQLETLTFVSYVARDTLTRLEARSLILPHILGLATKVRCEKCWQNTPSSIAHLFENRDDKGFQTEAIREVIHWLGNKKLCRTHDDTDLIPF